MLWFREILKDATRCALTKRSTLGAARSRWESPSVTQTRWKVPSPAGFLKFSTAVMSWEIVLHLRHVKVNIVPVQLSFGRGLGSCQATPSLRWHFSDSSCFPIEQCSLKLKLNIMCAKDGRSINENYGTDLDKLEEGDKVGVLGTAYKWLIII